MERTQKKQFYMCKRLRILNYLIKHGFAYEFTLPDMTDPHKLNWMFPRTEELTKTLDAYYEDLNRQMHTQK